MASGYAGRILKIDLTTRNLEEIPTSQYEEYGGGHGIGSALFWDLCEDKTIKPDDPRNVVTFMASPMSGTLAPGAAGRTEVQGLGLQGWPTGWFTRSNFGGRFSTQLKMAGWDGLAIVGQADGKVWLNIRDDKVTLEDATELWGLDTFETAKSIYSHVLESPGDWEVSGSRDAGRSTQRPAVVSVGPNAENFAPVAALVHDGGSGAGQGGLGGVLALKGLKAISVLGTGGVEIADPNALMEARLWLQQYSFAGHPDAANPYAGIGVLPLPSNPGDPLHKALPNRPVGCVACVRNCRGRNTSNLMPESGCIDPWYSFVLGLPTTEGTLTVGDLTQRYGVNAFMLAGAVQWLMMLHMNGIIGDGMEIQSSLPFDTLGKTEAFGLALVDSIVNNADIGADLALGLWQCAEKWGRLEQDTKTGWLAMDVWGYVHHYDGRTEAEWGYGSLMGDRDINEHDFNWVTYWCPSLWTLYGLPPAWSAAELAEIIAEKTPPYNDPMMIDYSDEGIYSEAMAKTVAWHRHYTRYYKEGLGFCDRAWADFANPFGPENRGATGEGEARLFSAITGNDQTFEEGIEVGRKIWNLDRAVWVLQGRNRDMEVFSDYMYEVGSVEFPGRGYAAINYEVPYVMPVYENGEWSYKNLAGRKLDRAKVEEWKTKYYELEGWDTGTGIPTRATLEELGLEHVADVLEAEGKMGVS